MKLRELTITEMEEINYKNDVIRLFYARIRGLEREIAAIQDRPELEYLEALKGKKEEG